MYKQSSYGFDTQTSEYFTTCDKFGTLANELTGIMELDTQREILAQNKLLTQQIEALRKQIRQLPQQHHLGGPQKTHQAHQIQQILRCDFCGGNQQNDQCSVPGDGKKRREGPLSVEPSQNSTKPLRKLPRL